MRKVRGFTLIELMITVAVLGVLLAVGVSNYLTAVEKAKSTEARMNVEAIRTAETIHMVSTGSFVAADNAAQINERLGLNIKPRYYEYMVVGVTNDNFIVIAQRIGQDVLADNLPFSLAVIASDINGPMANGFGQYLNTTGGGGGTSTSGVGGGTDSGGGTTSGGSTNPFGLGGGTTSGGSTGGGSGGAGGGSSGGGSSGGGSSGGGGVTRGGGGTVTEDVSDTEVVYDTPISAALNILNNFGASEDLIGFQSGTEIYNYIIDNNIPVSYSDMSPFWRGYFDPNDGTIHVNTLLGKYYPAQVVACTIAHETTHANYFYNPGYWINYTMQTYGVSQDQVSIPDNSVSQEYSCFNNAVIIWRENKGSYEDTNLDGLLAQYNQGPSVLWAEVVSRYSELPAY